MPGFRQVFDSLDSDLPAITTFVLETAESMKAHWAVWFGALVALVVGFMTFKKTERGAWMWDRFVLQRAGLRPARAQGRAGALLRARSRR